jgi:dTDP-glucose 4,6-dehydratase
VEKFIPKSIKAVALGRPIPLHDAGKPRRTWLHVSDTAQAVITIIESDVRNEIFNISGNYEEENLFIAKQILCAMNPKETRYENYLDLSINRPGQDVRYAIDDSKLKALGWMPRANFNKELIAIVKYYQNNFIW